jgi:hypothetical protein
MRRRLELASLLLLLALPLRAQEPVSMATTLSRDGASITFEFADAPSLALALDGQHLTVGGREQTRVTVNQRWARAFRELAATLGDLEPPAALEALREWAAPTGGPSSAELQNLLEEQNLFEAQEQTGGVVVAVPRVPAVPPIPDIDIAGVLAPLSEIQVSLGGLPRQMLHGPVTIDRGETVEGDLIVASGGLTLAGEVEGDVIALRGDVRLRRGARVDGDVIAVHGRVRNDGARVGGRIVSRAALASPSASPIRSSISVLGIVIAMALIGSGLLILAPRHLAIGAETIAAAPGRAFAAGLVGQALLLPTLVMLVVGLTITIVGVVAVPFAVLGYALLAAAAVLGGFLAVSQVVGERFAESRFLQRLPVAAQGAVPPLVVGIAVFGIVWLGAALLSGLPIAGTILLAIAILITWLALTVGLGGALLSRLGLREGFVGRSVPLQITDEFLWPTPIGSPAQRGVRRRSRKEES